MKAPVVYVPSCYYCLLWDEMRDFEQILELGLRGDNNWRL